MVPVISSLWARTSRAHAWVSRASYSGVSCPGTGGADGGRTGRVLRGGRAGSGGRPEGSEVPATGPPAGGVTGGAAFADPVLADVVAGGFAGGFEATGG